MEAFYPLTNDRELAALEDAQDLLQFAAAPQDLPTKSVHGILALPVCKYRLFLDSPSRAFGVAALMRQQVGRAPASGALPTQKSYQDFFSSYQTRCEKFIDTSQIQE